LGSLSQLINELAMAISEHEKLSSQQKQVQELVGSIKGKLQRCSDLEIKMKEKEKLFSHVLKEEKIYQDLSQAFGKKGIQALLIEMALPEIEIEANKLLGRMTDNRMHVKIEPQRETKKGDVVETLDINTSDELGTRNYEMFSGGETFRINFAIRIALSKLLAKRAGAPLPTLIIDEGFGTQDSVGIEKLKEAIKSIQDDFEKIIVITHIEELKDAFPTRIDVIKTAEGSTIEVN
ncbi:MAG: SbcC/MukB-like Walker B domain-containing protein, partial [Dehalococcoidales bacterium]|nr:SbcC/MukB-like Walker B domain-containing protein [Dehalococcoidales bacterium]